jgi:hypothetical protein
MVYRLSRKEPPVDVVGQHLPDHGRVLSLWTKAGQKKLKLDRFNRHSADGRRFQRPLVNDRPRSALSTTSWSVDELPGTLQSYDACSRERPRFRTRSSGAAPAQRPDAESLSRFSASRRRRWSYCRDSGQDLPEQPARHLHLGHLQRDRSAMPDNPGANRWRSVVGDHCLPTATRQ